MSSCDAWIQFVTPGDVKALKTRLQAYVVPLEAAVAQCPKIDPATRGAWEAFATSWRDYRATEEHFLTAGSEFTTGCEYERAITGWQQTIAGLACNVAGPPLASPGGGSADDSSTKRTVRTVAVAAGVVAVAIALRGITR